MKRPTKITIDIADPDSIDKGLAALGRYKVWELEFIAFRLKREICEAACEAANRVYGGYAEAKWHLAKGRGKSGAEAAVIYAQGKGGSANEICFIEFGTGIYADPGHILADPSMLGFSVYPGSWSETEDHDPPGKHTWSRWEAAHDGNMTGYRYNAPPLPGMEAAYMEIISHFDQIAKRAVDRDD